MNIKRFMGYYRNFWLIFSWSIFHMVHIKCNIYCILKEAEIHIYTNIYSFAESEEISERNFEFCPFRIYSSKVYNLTVSCVCVCMCVCVWDLYKIWVFQFCSYSV
jgi:hypothetical protein